MVEVSKSSMRLEKQVLLMRRQILAKCCEFADKYFEFKDAIADIANDSDMAVSDAWEWARAQIDVEFADTDMGTSSVDQDDMED